MAMSHKACLVALASLTAACAVRPDIVDVTGFSADDIVRKIQCETRDAIKDKLAVWLQTVRADPYAQEIYGPLLADTMSVRDVDVTKFHPRVAQYISYFLETGVAYDFTLNMTEKNDIDAKVDVLEVISGGTLTAGIGSGVRRTRNNTQTFTVAVTFQSLAMETEDSYCDPNAMPSGYFNEYENHVYPIAGNIGIAGMVDDFVNLTLFGRLDDPAKTDGPPTMTNSIEFTTHVYGDLVPKIVIAPTITGASLGFKNNREDKHKVIIAFALKDDPVFAAERTVQRDFVVASGNPTEQRAVDAVDRFIRRTELGRTSIIIDGSTVIP